MNKKLNIGLFIDTFYPMIDGVVSVVDNYAKRLCKVANVTVFAPKSKNGCSFDDTSLPYKVVRCKALDLGFIGLDYSLPLPKKDKSFIQAIKDANLDLIHIHSPFSIGKMGSIYGKKNNIPVIATLHSQYKKDFYKSTHSILITKAMVRTIAKTFNRADVLWTMSSGCANLAREYGFTGKAEIIPNATDLINNFSKAEIHSFKNEIKAKYNIKDNEKILINIGRIHKLKNLDFVLDVCKDLKDKHFEFKLLLIGDGKDKKHFIKRVKKLRLDKNVIFVGRISDANLKSKFISISDLHIFPSSYDTDGIVRIEAAAFSVPTIFIKNSLASSTISENKNGYIGEDNKELFAQKIIDIFNNDNEYQKVKLNSKNDLYLTWDELMPTIYAKYQNLIKEKKCKTI